MFKPRFTITPEILKDVSEIAEIKAVVERSRVLPLNEAQLKRQAIIRMAHTSTSIEGNQLAEFQVKKVLEGGTVNADQKSIQEVKNYQQALQKIEELAKEQSVLTLDQLLTIHSLVTKNLLPADKAGHFRPGDIYIVDDDGKKEHVRYAGPESKKIPFLMNELLVWLSHSEKQDLHPLLQAGIFHSFFINIHPFADGNGRMARLLTTLILYKASWDFRKIIVVEDFYNRDRQKYYDSLKATSGLKFDPDPDFTPWLEYFFFGFVVEARKVAEALNTMGFGQVQESGKQVFLDHDEIQVMDFLTTTGRLTSSDVEDVLGVAKRTAQLKLKSLVDKGLLNVEGKGPATFYTLKQ